MALKIVQTYNQLSAGAGTATTTGGIALRTGYIRVSTAATAVYLDIGGNPVATVNSFHIPTQGSEILKERVARQTISGITTGATTVITFPENAGNPFLVGDYVTIENASPSGINTSHNIITASTDSSITVSFNSTSISGIALTTATVARSVKVSALGLNSGTTVSIAEVQISSQA